MAAITLEVCQHDDSLECLDERQGGYVFDVRRDEVTEGIELYCDGG